MEENRKTELMHLAGRLERLRRLMGQNTPQEASQPVPAMEEGEKQENMLMAAIPFLDQEYQRDLYVVVRLMEMRRMLTGGVLQARSRDTLPPSVRRRQMLSAIRPCLSQREQTRLDTLMRVMDAREILIQKEGLDGLDKGTNGGEERLRLIREAQEKSKDKTGLERLDVFLEYGEALAQGGTLSKEEQKALLAAVSQNLPENDRAQIQQIMGLMGL